MTGPISRRNSCVAARSIAPNMTPPAAALCARRAPLATSRRTGGWSFALDPDLSATEAPAIWQPGGCALVAVAEPAPRDLAARPLADLIAAAPIVTEAIAPGEWHLVLGAGGRRYRLAILRCAANEPLAYIAPIAASASLRLALSGALHRILSAPRSARPAACGVPGRSERWRLIQLLRMLDGLAASASPRELAAILLPGRAAGFSASEWDASSERRRIARWRRSAIAMRDGGYRSLLAP